MIFSMVMAKVWRICGGCPRLPAHRSPRFTRYPPPFRNLDGGTSFPWLTFSSLPLYLFSSLPIPPVLPFIRNMMW